MHANLGIASFLKESKKRFFFTKYRIFWCYCKLSNYG